MQPLPVPRRNYDLEIRTFRFAQRVRGFVQLLPRTMLNGEDVPQLLRASGSIGANYIEANNSLSKKDFAMRVTIALREAKEAAYWLRLVDLGTGKDLEPERQVLWKEAEELYKIFGSILSKVRNPKRSSAV